MDNPYIPGRKALNTAAVSNNPPAAAANVIHDLLLATEHPQNRLAEAAAAVVGAIFATEGSGVVVVGILALVYWSLTRLAPVTSTQKGVRIAARYVPLRRFAPYLSAFAIPSILLGVIHTIS